jgi:hypothetical protein
LGITVNAAIYAVVEVVIIQISKMIVHLVENQFDQVHVRSHGGAAVVQQYHHLNPISQFLLENQFYLATVSGTAINGLLDVEFCWRAGRHHVLERGEDLAEVFGPKRGVGGIVHVTACIDDLKGGAVKRVTVDPNAFTVAAGMAKG